MKTTPIIYYASSKTKYFHGGSEVTKYIVHAHHETKEMLGNLNTLKELGAYFSQYYSENLSTIRLHNCTTPLEEKGFRKLSTPEKAMFLDALLGKK